VEKSAMRITPKIAAVSVNHNTSSYMELMLRSFFATHSPQLNCTITIYDNGSEDNRTALQEYAAAKQIPIIQTGYRTESKNNSHGEILRRFVLNTPDCTHYLFLDADICFIEEKTIDSMLTELTQDASAFGIGPRMSWDGVAEIPEDLRKNNPDIQDARLHPCCALVKNTPLFRQVVEEVGLSAVNYLWAEQDEYLDTFKLMTRVMRTHGLTHRTASAMIVHFFAVSYAWDAEEFRQWKAGQRDQRLEVLRASE
jgi:hypothetical protein